MKITEDCIDHNVMLIIDNLTEDIYNVPDDQKGILLGEIRGVIDLAIALKDVLKL